MKLTQDYAIVSKIINNANQLVPTQLISDGLKRYCKHSLILLDKLAL